MPPMTLSWPRSSSTIAICERLRSSHGVMLANRPASLTSPGVPMPSATTEKARSTSGIREHDRLDLALVAVGVVDGAALGRAREDAQAGAIGHRDELAGNDLQQQRAGDDPQRADDDRQRAAG